MKQRARVVSFSRQEFLTRRWLYLPGQHVSLLGPTGAGKTWLGFQLLEYAATPELPALVLAMKPRDKTVADWGKRLEMPTVRTWPPPAWAKAWKPRPPGWVLWPKHSYDPDRDDPAHQKIFQTALLDSYKRGNRIVFGDEAYSLCNELKMVRPLKTLWTKGRSMGCGLWSATQRPAFVPYEMYSQAQHLFLHRDPDEAARKRYREISGIDSALVRDILTDLPKHHWLYVRQEDQALCVVEP